MHIDILKVIFSCLILLNTKYSCVPKTGFSEQGWKYRRIKQLLFHCDPMNICLCYEVEF